MSARGPGGAAERAAMLIKFAFRASGAGPPGGRPRRVSRKTEPYPRMHTSAELHVAYQVANAPVLPFPFPHLLVRDVFPPDFYRAIRAHLPARESMTSLKAMGRVGDGYRDGRLVLPLDAAHLAELEEPRRAFWSGLSGWMLSGPFANLLLDKFGEVVSARGDLNNAQLTHEAMLVQDQTDFALGPHTGRAAKVLSLHFYLAADDTRPQLGISVYLPRDGQFRCPGGPHYSFDAFQRVYTMPYVPNTLFAFAKSDHSFHGVERMTEIDAGRDMLLYDIFLQPVAQGPFGVTGNPPPGGNPA